ncbi:hypothetical protein IH982_01085 [Patescibacteria group bacterium]|nr:hypothetical protein [Patescibacteria group bacterium]
MKQILPKVEFRYSWIYDENLKEWTKAPRERKKFSSQKILNYIKTVEPLWRKHEKSVLREMSKVLELPWHAKKIPCYVVAWSTPFSDPLTVPFRPDKNRFIDTLTHELIHQLFFQGNNVKRAAHAWQYIHRKYKREQFNTRIHVPLHAVHEHIFRCHFGEDRLDKEYAWMKHFNDYKRSWDIVKKDGYLNIINEFRGRTKRGI